MADITRKVGNLDATLAQGKVANYAMSNVQASLDQFGLLPAIPKDYYCKWKITLNSLHTYYLKVIRDSPALE